MIRIRTLAAALLGLAVVPAAQAAVLSAGSLVVTVRDDNGAIASVTNNGIEYYAQGTFVADYGIQINGDNTTFASNTIYGASPITVTSVAGGGGVGDSITVIGSYMGLEFSRTYTLLSADTYRTVTTWSNTSGADVTLQLFDTFDPDQGIDQGLGFNTINDVNADGNALTATAGTETVMAFNPTLGSALGFQPDFALGIFTGAQLDAFLAGPYDPNGADQDIGYSIARSVFVAVGDSGQLAFDQTFTGAAVPAPAGLVLLAAAAPVFGLRRVLRRKVA
ncbi:MAG: hypothetical protein K2X87_14815 [Gemmataceae bacterium]|nr:hypothetical protein [Gemmataceae bacterium]